MEATITKNNWQKTCDYIDGHEFFHIHELRALVPKVSATEQYRYHLKRAGYIKGLSKGHYQRLKMIEGLSIYKCEKMAIDLN